MSNNQIPINPGKVFRFLVIVEVLLIIASLGTNLITYLTGHDYMHGYNSALLCR